MRSYAKGSLTGNISKLTDPVPCGKRTASRLCCRAAACQQLGQCWTCSISSTGLTPRTRQCIEPDSWESSKSLGENLWACRACAHHVLCFHGRPELLCPRACYKAAMNGTCRE